jgi:hypothetical protein
MARLFTAWATGSAGESTHLGDVVQAGADRRIHGTERCLTKIEGLAIEGLGIDVSPLRHLHGAERVQAGSQCGRGTLRMAPHGLHRARRDGGGQLQVGVALQDHGDGALQLGLGLGLVA